MWGLANAGPAARCLHVAAELGVADHVDSAPVPVADLRRPAERTPTLWTAFCGCLRCTGSSSAAHVGGGRGHLLRAVLDAAPSATGVPYDLPEVIESLDVGHPRMATAAGDFFAGPLPEADADVLMGVMTTRRTRSATAS